MSSDSLWEQLHPLVLRVTKMISFEKAHLVAWHNNDSGWATFRDSSSRYIPLLLVHYCGGFWQWRLIYGLAATESALGVSVLLKCKDDLPRPEPHQSVYCRHITPCSEHPYWRICSLFRQNTRHDPSEETRNMHFASLLSIPDKISSMKWKRAWEWGGWMERHLSW